jgi:hypothetical protein
MTKAEKAQVAQIQQHIANLTDSVNFGLQAQAQRNNIFESNIASVYRDTGSHESRLYKLETFVEGYWFALKAAGFVLAIAAIFALGVLAGAGV